MKEMYFKAKLRIYYYGEPVYVADGTIAIQNDKLKGYVALDYICGSYNEKTQILQLQLYEYNWDNDHNHKRFEGPVELFELPNEFELYDTAKDSCLIATMEIGPKLQINEGIFKEYFNEVAQIHGF